MGLGAAWIPIVGCVLLVAAIILHVLSFASPYWVDDSEGDFGLWRRVVCVDKESFDDHDEGCYRYEPHWDVDRWLDVVRALECITVILWSLPIVILPVYIYVARGLYYRVVLGTVALLTLIGVFSNGGGVLVAWLEVMDTDDYSLGWCVYTCLVSCGVGFIAAIFLMVATCRKPNFPQKRTYFDLYVDPDKNQLYIVEAMETSKPNTIPIQYQYMSQANPVYG